MSGALSESAMIRILERIQSLILRHQGSLDPAGPPGHLLTSPGDVVREIRTIIDTDLARPHMILHRMMETFPEKQYQVTSVQSDIHRSISNNPQSFGKLDESITLTVDIIRL